MISLYMQIQIVAREAGFASTIWLRTQKPNKSNGISQPRTATRDHSTPDRVQLFRRDQQFLGDLGDLAALRPGIGAQDVEGLIAIQSVA